MRQNSLPAMWRRLLSPPSFCSFFYFEGVQFPVNAPLAGSLQQMQVHAGPEPFGSADRDLLSHHSAGRMMALTMAAKSAVGR